MNQRNDAPENPLPLPQLPIPAGRMALAWLALLWERLWPALWPLVGIAGVFVSLALLDVLPDLPFWLHIALIAGFVAALGWAVWRAFRSVAPPDRLAARRRLERDNKLDHRPLAALQDQLVAGKADSFAEALWREHRRRLMASLRRLKVALPMTGTARRDPLAIRALVILLLAVALAAGWGELLPRLQRAVVPSPEARGPAAVTAMEMWITPPDYTGLAPIFVRASDQKSAPGTAVASAPPALSVPANSKLLAQIHGRAGEPLLKLDKAEQKFTEVDPVTHRLETVLKQSGRLAISAGKREFGVWNLEVVPDKAPTVEFPQPPQRTQRAAMRLEYEAKDDYGVASVKAVIRLMGEDNTPLAREEPIELELPLPGLRLKTAKAASFHDLTAHIWAGLKVEMKLIAADEIGQTGESAPLVTVLPERVFNHPVARMIVEQRRILSLNPDKRREVAAILLGLAQRPQHFFDDTVVFLSLKTAQARLMRDRSKEGTRAVQDLLWDTALRIEDGKMSIAERELRDAERRLQEALNRNASDPEIEKLINELQQALEQYLQAMMEQMRRQIEQGMQPQPMDPNARMIDSRDLQRMIEQARELARQGNRDAAKQMLSQLREMLENMRMGAMQQNQRGQQAQQMMNGLQDLIKRQRDLLDQTFRQAQREGRLPQNQQGQQGQQGQRQQGQRQRGQQGQQGQQGQEGQEGQEGQQGQMGRNGAARQGQLRGDLGEFLRKLDEMMGGIPRPFGRADRAMRDAQQSLEGGEPGEAVGHQNQALDQLQEAARSMMEQMMQQFGMQPGQGEDSMPPQSMGPMQPRPNQGRDPFGRPMNNFGGMDTGDVEIPAQSDLQRAREILDELRKRKGEQDRPVLERDYIDRLLRRF